MNEIKVSVILPSLNVRKYIKDCIESVVNQTLKEIEIIFIDAGSTDGTLELLEKYASLDERIVIIKSYKKSYGYQANLGIMQAKGEYIGIVDTDDFVDFKMYDELYSFAKKNNADVIKCPYIEYFDKKHQTLCYYAEFFKNIFPKGCFSCKEHGELLAYHASVWAGIYKKDYILKNNLFFVEASGAGYVDVGFRYDTCTNTEKCSWYSKPFYYYRVSNQNSSTNNFNLHEMIIRWHELHVKSLPIKPVFDKYYAPFLVFDEYLNTISYLKVIYISDDDLDLLIDNIGFLDKKIIINSPVMKWNEKKDFLSFMNNPKQYAKRYRRFIPLLSALKRVSLVLFPKGSKRRMFLKKIRVLIGQ